MKILILLLAVLLAASSPASSQVFGKKKSAEAPAADPKVDSLTKANQTLTLKADSLSKDLAKYIGAYTGLYTVLKDKVFRYNFDPAKLSFLIDSLRGSKDATSAALLVSKPISTLPPDSLAALVKQTTLIRANMDSMKVTLERIRSAIPAEDRDKFKALNSLKQYKTLLDDKVITDEEFLILKKKCLNNL
jgi:hypothetical protein